MSNPGRARGTRLRGRGRGRAEQASAPAPPEADPTLDPLLQQLAALPVDQATDPSSFRPSASSSAPQGTSTVAPAKFKPRIVKRVEKVEGDAEGLEDNGGYERGGRGRGRGRGRGADRGGRGRGEIFMTASGAFALGPAEASSRTSRNAHAPTQSGMRRIDNSATPVGDRSRTGTSTGGTFTTSGEGFDLYSDGESNGSQNEDANEEGHERARIADLNEINLEHPMAPVSLPWDAKRTADREKMIEERKAKAEKSARLKLKSEPGVEDVKPSTSTSRCSTAAISSAALSRSNGSNIPESTSGSVVLEEKDMEALKNEIKLQKEQLEELSKVGKHLIGSGSSQRTGSHDRSPEEPDSSSCPFYIFQFPRHFPTFSDPEKPSKIKEDERAVDKKPIPGGSSKVVKKKKPGVDDWMGWGKGGRRTDYIGVSPDEEDKNLQGQIGEMVIRRSGRVQMIIGDAAYDVLRAAQATFHQELAVIDPSPESKQRSMFVLGKTTQKFIVVPDVKSLLELEKQEQIVKTE